MEKKLSRKDLCQLRIEKLKTYLRDKDLDGVVVVPGPNLRYYSGVNSLLLERPFLFFVPRDGYPHLVAPKLESGPYLRAPVKIIVHDWDDSEGPSRAFENLASQLVLKGKWGVEGRVPFRFIHELLKHAKPQLDDAEPILENMREFKEPKEIQLLATAASILSKSFLKIPHMLTPGSTELELARKIREQVYSNGAETVDDVLVQSGALAADPHHLPSPKKLRKKESIVVDATCTYSGYYADITRTFIIGNDRKFEDLYESTLEAQQRAIKAVKAGLTVGSIDQAARECLAEKGLRKYFIHRTGHGLGLEVHEAPYIVPGGMEIVQPCMVFTVEPGVYMPKRVGVRIEDDVVATSVGCKVLTEALPKEFRWWS